jgi:hypothetical protein
MFDPIRIPGVGEKISVKTENFANIFVWERKITKFCPLWVVSARRIQATPKPQTHLGGGQPTTRCQAKENAWREAVLQDTRSSPVPDVVAFRVDFGELADATARPRPPRRQMTGKRRPLGRKGAVTDFEEYFVAATAGRGTFRGHYGRQRMARFTHRTDGYARTIAVFWASNIMTLSSR